MSGDAQPRGPSEDAERPRGVEITYVEEDPKRSDLEHWEKFATENAGRVRRRVPTGPDRRRLLTIAAGAVALLILALLMWRPWSGSDAAGKALGGDSAAVLIQLRGEEGQAIANAIVMHDRTGPRGTVVGVPDHLSVDVPVLGVDSSGEPDDVVTVGEALLVAGEALSRDGLADVLGIEIDGSWVLEAGTFGTLVDRLGGIEIDSARVDGDIALARATSPSEPPAVRAERFAGVLVGLFGKIPQDFQDTRDLLNAIGLVGDEQLAAILSGVAGDLADEVLPTAVLPVQESGLLEIDAASPMVHDLLGPQVRARSADATPRVLVQIAQNASGDELAGVREAVRAAVVNAGYRFIDGGVVEGRASSSITTYGNSGIGDTLALTLELDQGVVSAASGGGLADALVVLGGDYRR